jgi:hypothetical protein
MSCKLKAISSSWRFHRHISTMRGIALGARTGPQRSHPPLPASIPARTRPRSPLLVHASSHHGPRKRTPSPAGSLLGRRRRRRRCISRRHSGRMRSQQQDRQRGPQRTGGKGPYRGRTCPTWRRRRGSAAGRCGAPSPSWPGPTALAFGCSRCRPAVAGAVLLVKRLSAASFNSRRRTTVAAGVRL